MTVNRDFVESRAAESGDGRLPILYPDNIAGAPDTIRLTIQRATGIRRGTMFKVEFREYPGRILWAVKRGLLNIVEAHGDDEALWPGRVVVLEKVRRTDPHSGRQVDKYDFAPMTKPPSGRVSESPRLPASQARALYPKASKVWDEPVPGNESGTYTDYPGERKPQASQGRPRRLLKRRPPRRPS